MSKILETGKLADGRKFDIIRYQTEEAETPQDLRAYFLASFVTDAKHFGSDLGFWLGDVAARIDGKHREICVDTFYAARVENEFAARLWFGIAKRTKIGNFGHVCTEVKFRRLGLLNRLMEHFTSDFKTSSARIVTCGTDNPVASRCYAKHGFQLPYGGENGVMTYGENFLPMAEKIYDGKGNLQFRIGDGADQFGIDKFLSPSPAFHNGLASNLELYLDCRTALQEQKEGRALVCIADNCAGFPVGCAVIRRMGKCNLLDYMLHPKYQQWKTDFLEAAKKAFQTRFTGESKICNIAD